MEINKLYYGLFETLAYFVCCYTCLNTTDESTFDDLCRFNGMCLNCSDGGCDDMCTFYDNNCCTDSTTTNTLLKKWQYSCVRTFPDMYDLHLDCRGSQNGVYGIYMVTKCSETWNDRVIKSKCENSANDDILSRIPVYDYKNEKVTFKNMFCAFCNGVAISKIKFWKFDLMCNREQEVKGTEECFIRLVYRQHRMCAVNVIENCSEKEVKNSSLRALCENGITQNVYVWKYVNVFTVYKNEFCAKCNKEAGELQCWAFQAFTCWPQDLPPYRNVQAMVNLNLYGQKIRDSKKILSSKCGDNVLYDPLSIQCLNVTCLRLHNICISGKCRLVELSATDFEIFNDSSIHIYSIHKTIPNGRYFFEESKVHACLDDLQYKEWEAEQQNLIKEQSSMTSLVSESNNLDEGNITSCTCSETLNVSVISMFVTCLILGYDNIYL